MNKPELTETVQKKIRSMIEMGERHAKMTGETVDPKLYLQLADLYHFHKDYRSENQILNHYVNLDFSVKEDLTEIYERIDRVSALKGRKVEQAVESIKLELVPEIGDDEKISISSQKEVVRRVNQDRRPFTEQRLKIIALSVAYTGRNDDDEVAQIAIVLFEYIPERKKSSKLLESYAAKRKTKVTIPAKVVNQFNLKEVDILLPIIDLEKVRWLFEQADFVVSHNDAEVERKLLATLIPEIADIKWYSSERDIPWRALGYDTNRLTQLSKTLGEKMPRTCSERANTIRQILQKTEPYSTHIYLERLYNMQSMKAFEWTPKLRAQHLRLNGGDKYGSLWVASCFFVLVVTIVTVIYYYWM